MSPCSKCIALLSPPSIAQSAVSAKLCQIRPLLRPAYHGRPSIASLAEMVGNSAMSCQEMRRTMDSQMTTSGQCAQRGTMLIPNFKLWMIGRPSGRTQPLSMGWLRQYAPPPFCRQRFVDDKCCKLQNLHLRAMRKPPSDCQFCNAMHHRPGEQGEVKWAAGR
jgi:hypothetical protein